MAIRFHDLDETEQYMLRQANEMLTLLTASHDPECECELCDARALTDVADEDTSFHIEYTPAGEGIT